VKGRVSAFAAVAAPPEHVRLRRRVHEGWKPYDLQIQPREKHGFHGAGSLNFRNQAILAFFEQNLK
jgi:dipeptidyl aminopeptidase/acylaminoacyl peptidase